MGVEILGNIDSGDALYLTACANVNSSSMAFTGGQFHRLFMNSITQMCLNSVSVKNQLSRYRFKLSTGNRVEVFFIYFHCYIEDP